MDTMKSISNWLNTKQKYMNTSKNEIKQPTKKRLYRQLRARKALLQLKDVPLRTRRALLLYNVNGNSALLVLNGTSLICNIALLALNL